MPNDLRSRLKRIRESSATAGQARPMNPGGKARCEDGAPARSEWLERHGWARLGDQVWERRVEWPGIHTGATMDAGYLSARGRGSLVAPEDIVFFDLETTGLSGGTGTIAFLSAFGSFGRHGYSVRQIFLEDYPGEPLFLEASGDELSRFKAVASYNGASFDLPLYKARRTMNGLPPVAPALSLDLLHAARRLWRGVLPDCSLSSVERGVLGVRRTDDLPGSEVPDAWFRFLATGPHPELALAMDHNQADVAGLASLYGLLSAGLAAGRLRKADPRGLASLIARVDLGRAARVLERSLRTGDAGAVPELMRLYWKLGRRDERLALIPLLPDDARGLYLKSIHAERVLGDAQSATRFAESAAKLAGSSEKACDAVLARRAERRLRRLEQLPAPDA